MSFFFSNNVLLSLIRLFGNEGLTNNFRKGFHTVITEYFLQLSLYGFKSLHKYFLFPVFLKKKTQ